MTISIRRINRIAEIPRQDWNRLLTDNNPFVRHEFLAALETHEAVSARFGWWPCHLAAYDQNNRLIGACPMYLKENSYGEFVFDWSWADAYQRAGGDYYPKAVVAIPYTPAAGPRLLSVPELRMDVVPALIQAAMTFMQEEKLSSLHWLFTPEADTQALISAGHSLRLGCQYHWFNEQYRDFADYLDGFVSRHRKNVRKERRKILDAGIELRPLSGAELTDEQWSVWQGFYESTFRRKSGLPTLSQGFFRELGQTMGEQLLLVFAYHSGQPIAASFMLRSDTTLYGRHWGCEREYDGLHFEACYYQGLDYCIDHGLACFEPGAQGEHKVGRGFRPTATYSAHWIADTGFRRAVARFLDQERPLVAEYMAELSERLPFRRGHAS